ncbi:MAG TPA: YetF domain-containing protein [Burkholderiaceae bacterium]|nr:YetF domain-containing protein [Burkholderiaceae bacterium]
MELMPDQLLLQALKALAYYAALIVIMRLAGKRLAGQTTTFDLIVLITLGVVIQSTALDEGWPNAVVFVVTVFAAHRGLAAWCAHSTWIRHLVRGKPRVLVRDGNVIQQALDREGVSRDELQAGLRKLGYDSPESVKLAVLEETGHISAVGADGASPSITPERLSP